jgi:protein SCO1/2
MNKRTIGIIIGGVIAFIVLAVGIYRLLDAVESNSSQRITIIEDTNNAPTGDNNTILPPSDGRNIIAPPQLITDFTMTAHTGEPFTLDDVSGRYVLLAFGYTHCPDVCPATLLEFRQIYRQLGDLGEDVAFMLISVDPARDTPEILNRYIGRYDPSFIGLSGDVSELEAIAPDFGLFWDIRRDTVTHAGYIVDHTASRFLLDRNGQLIRVYSFTADPFMIEADIRDLITQSVEG